MQRISICLVIISMIGISCSVIPKNSLNRTQLEALDEIELASSKKATKYALEDLNSAIDAYNNGQKYLALGTDDVSGVAYNSFLDSIEHAKRAKKKARFSYTKELIDRNVNFIEKNKSFLKSIGVYENYSIESYNSLLILSNFNINLAQKNSFKLFDKMNQLSRLDISQADNSLIKNYKNKDKIFIEKGKPKIRVNKGDTLRKVANTFMGSSKYSEEIYQINRANIPNPNTLRVGQKIILPKFK